MDGTCSLCDKPCVSLKYGWCEEHYRRFLRTGDPLVAGTGVRRFKGLCSFDGCDKDARTKGLCLGHYDQFHRRGDDLSKLTPLHTLQSNLFIDLDGERRECADCHEIKSFSEFNKQTGQPGNVKHHCRACDRVYQHADRLWRMYKLTPAMVIAILEEQDGCAICHSPEPLAKHGWTVDHDHACCPGQYTCGKCVRGVLCQMCNVGLGSFRDSQEFLMQAVKYLANAGGE
jgi:hypothetical protein